MKTEIKNGNYKATITLKQDGYGDSVFQVMALCMTGTHTNGDVCFLKSYDKLSSAMRAANKVLAKLA